MSLLSNTPDPANQDALKKAAALAAVSHLPSGAIIGVGTGSTVDHFIDALASVKHRIEGAVASSLRTEQRLKQVGIDVLELNSVGELAIYIDGADEINRSKHMIKGGGGALTREKILASASKKFLCIVDESKYTDALGNFPIAIEVIPMARSFVARALVQLGGHPLYREHVITDNGNVILDVHHLSLVDPCALEKTLNQLPGIVEHGIFALRPADGVIMATAQGIQEW